MGGQEGVVFGRTDEPLTRAVHRFRAAGRIDGVGEFIIACIEGAEQAADQQAVDGNPVELDFDPAGCGLCGILGELTCLDFAVGAEDRLPTAPLDVVVGTLEKR